MEPKSLTKYSAKAKSTVVDQTGDLDPAIVEIEIWREMAYQFKKKMNKVYHGIPGAGVIKDRSIVPRETELMKLIGVIN